MGFRGQRGIGLVTLLIVMPMLAWLIQDQVSLARATQSALEDQRAVDRSAFSMAAVVADTLNQISINNQGIVASHLLQGHLVTQLAWTRYATQLAHRGSWVMGWGAPSVAVHAHQAASRALKAQEQLMPLWTQRLNLTAQAYQASNRLAQMGLADSLFKANQTAGGGLTTAVFNPLDIAAVQTSEITHPIKTQAIKDRRWLNQRGWSQSFFGLLRLNKKGTTQEDAGQWKAQDQLTFRVRKLFRTKTVTVASGQADSRTFGYWGAGQIMMLDRQHLWVRADSGAHRAHGEAFNTDLGDDSGLLLRPTWNAQLADPLSSRGS